MPHVAAGMICLGQPKEIRAVLSELGADPEEVIAEAGLDPRLLDCCDSVVSMPALGALAQLCAERTGCPHVGLLVGQRIGLESLRLIGMLMVASNTLGDALRALEARLPVQNCGAVLDLKIEEQIAVVTCSLYDRDGEGACHVLDGGLAMTARVIRELCGIGLAPVEVLVPRRKPDDPEPYHRVFRGPVRFDQESAALVLPADWLERPLRTADPVRRQALEDLVMRLDNVSPKDLRDEIRQLLCTRLARTRCSAASVARLLSIHRRTLNRRLKAEGTAFRTVADEIRYGIARQLLVDTDLPVVQISAALDFSEAAAFTRAFRRWSGAAPSTWRATRRVGLLRRPG